MVSTSLSMIRGDSKTFNVHLRDGAGVDIDITDWTIFFTVKRAEKDTDTTAVIKKDVTVHTDATHGQTSIMLTPSDTSSLPPVRYVYDIQSKSDTNIVITLAKGVFTIEADITRRDVAE